MGSSFLCLSLLISTIFIGSFGCHTHGHFLAVSNPSINGCFGLVAGNLLPLGGHLMQKYAKPTKYQNPCKVVRLYDLRHDTGYFCLLFWN